MYTVGLAGCGIRDYLERIKQLVQFFGQIDEMFHKEAIHSLKPRISVEVSVCKHLKHCILYLITTGLTYKIVLSILYRISKTAVLLASKWPVI